MTKSRVNYSSTLSPYQLSYHIVLLKLVSSRPGYIMRHPLISRLINIGCTKQRKLYLILHLVSSLLTRTTKLIKTLAHSNAITEVKPGKQESGVGSEAVRGK